MLYCDSSKCVGKKYPIKPNIVFFGEGLPAEFMPLLTGDTLDKCDLLIIMGTALAVAPFNMLHRKVPEGCLKVLMNMTNTKETGGIDFTEVGKNKLFI